MNATSSSAIGDEGAKMASWEHRSHCVEVTSRTSGSWKCVDSETIAAVTLQSFEVNIGKELTVSWLVEIQGAT